MAKSVLKNFTKWTSAHGIIQLGRARKFALAFWSLLYLLLLSMFFWQIYVIFAHYYEYGINVDTQIIFEQRPFPAVTICSLNPYKLNKVSLAPDFETMMKNFSLSEKLEEDSVKSDIASSMETLADIKERIVYSVSELSNEHWEQLTYNLEEILQECRIGEHHCKREDFIKVRDPFYGACYTFNMNKTYKTSWNGPLYGLSLMLQVDQEKFLPIATTSAYRITIHDQENEAFPDAFGYNAGIGYSSSLALTFTKIARLGDPFGGCVESTKSLPAHFLYPNKAYTAEACLRSCYQSKIVQHCQCSDPRFPSNADVKIICTKNELSCVREVDSIISMQGCQCENACNDTQYIITSYEERWPQRGSLPGNRGHPYECSAEKWRGEVKECMDWWQQNTLRVQVYYDRLSYKLLQSEQAYTSTDILLDIGGQIGLWLGMSVISIVEILCFCIVTPLSFAGFKKARKVIPKHSEAQKVSIFNSMGMFGSEVIRKTSNAIARFASPKPERRDQFANLEVNEAGPDNNSLFVPRYRF